MSRSSLVFLAKQRIPDRFLLVHMTAKGARAMHQGQSRTVRFEDSVNGVLRRIAGADLPCEPPIDPGGDPEAEGVL